MVTFIVGLAAASACTARGEPGGCFRDKDNACVEYGAEQAVGGKRLCAGYTWLPGERACPKDGRVGTCRREGGRVAEYVYGGPPNRFTAASAKTTCEASAGTFSP